MMTYIILSILVILIAWFLENCLHEGSHLLAAYLLNGWAPLEFKPYPHKHEGKWYFARCTYEKSRYVPIPEWVHIAPAFAGWWWGWVWTVIAASIWRCDGHWWFLACIPAGMGFFDFFWFWRGYWWGSEHSDGKRFRKAYRL